MCTDPDGEFFFLIPLAAGLINLGIHSQEGHVGNFWQGLGYFAQGAIGGFFSQVPLGGPLAATLNIVSTSASILFGNTRNALRVFMGQYYFDENMGHGFLQALTRYSWEFPQTWAGYNYTQFRNTGGYVDRVDYLGGATFATDENNGTITPINLSGLIWGVTLGSFINISIPKEIDMSFRDYVFNDHQIYLHEYGHTIQSQILGPGYLIIGLFSLNSAAHSETIDGDPYRATTHKYYWTETWANRLAGLYFRRNYGYTWIEEDGYPFYDYH